MLILKTYSHGIYVTGFTTQHEVNTVASVAARFKTMIRYIEHKKVKYKVGMYYTVTNKVYTKVIAENFFTFLRSRLEELIDVLYVAQIPHTVEVIDPYLEEKDVNAKPITFKVENKKLWEEQIPYVDYICNPGIRKLIPLQTGSGKGTILSFSLAKLEGRSFFQIKRSYLVKLRTELLEDTNLYGDDIVILKSTKEIYKLVDNAVDGKRLPKVIMCPMGMLDIYIDNWKKGVYGFDFNHKYNPVHLFTLLKVKTRVIDETHEWFDKIYLIDTMTNVEKSIYLSGTFDADPHNDKLRFALQNQLISLEDRPPNVKPKKFGNFIKQPYRLPGCDNIIYKSENSMYGYSHIKYEQGIIARKLLKDAYFSILGDIFQKYFIDWIHPDDGDQPRSLYLFALTETCTEFTKYMRQRYNGMDIRRYIGEDSNDVLEEAKHIISTVKSCGTAIDIKGITLCVNTFVTKKKELIIQIRGRLRNPANRGLKTMGVYALVYNSDSKWHLEAVNLNHRYIEQYMEFINDNPVIDLGIKK